MKNPFLSPYQTPFGTVPFDQIKLEHYLPAIEQGIKEGKAEIEAIKNNPEPATFANTIEKLERNGELIGKVSTVFFNLNSAETSDEMQALAQEVSPLLTAYGNEIRLDEKLFERVKEAYQNTDPESLNKEQAWLLEKTYKGFTRNGALLSKKDKEKLKQISTELSMKSLKFSENLLKDSALFELWIEDEKDLAGLPEGVREAAKMTAKEKGKEDAWVFTLDYPSYIPFMKYSDQRELREKLYKAFASRAMSDNEYNNEAVVKDIVSLRIEKAKLLGYKTHADYVLEERMAEKPSNVTQLWDELLEHALPIAQEDLKEVQALANQLGGPKEIRQWDFSYYSEKLKDQKFSLNDELLKPYFQLEKVIDGAFQTAGKLYGISFRELDNVATYHQDVTTYEVLDDQGNHLAILYADFFPRKGKRSGAWMTSYRGQNKYDGKEQRPHVSIVCNFTKPTNTKPSLLTFNEVTTLFHEFGHALHGIFANGYYESLSGTSVYWDFVELPSQLMENWCYEAECLSLFARHYQTDKMIPLELVQKIKESINFMSAYQTVRQVGLGQLDFAWHNRESVPEESVDQYEKESTANTSLFPSLEGTSTSCAFGHIFAGGYSAGYYSYKWAEVLEADAFEFFKETGVFNRETAMKFKNEVLSKGGSTHPMELYKNFRGQAPKVDALLRKSGLVKVEL